MKIILAAALFLSICLRIAIQNPPLPQSIADPLPRNLRETNLRRIGEEGPLQNGASVIFRTGYSSAGSVTGYHPSYLFPDGEICPALRIRWSDGRTEWVKRKRLRKAFTEERWIEAKRLFSGFSIVRMDPDAECSTGDGERA